MTNLSIDPSIIENIGIPRLKIRNRNIRNSKNKYNQENQFINMNLTQLDLCMPDTEKTQDQLSKWLKGNLPLSNLLNIITNLFYSDSPTKAPKIYDLIQNVVSNCAYPDSVRRLEKLLKYCKVYSKILKKSSIKLTKDKLFGFNEDNLEVQINKSIDGAIKHLELQINIEHILNSNDVGKLTTLIDNTMTNIDKLLSLNKYDVTENEANKTKSSIVFSSLSGITGNSAITVKHLISNIDHSNLIANGINAVGSVVAGGFWTLAEASKNDRSNIFYQKLGVEKTRLLYLYMQLSKKGYSFTMAQRRYIEKILQIKRGNVFNRFFSYKTNSYRTFVKLEESFQAKRSLYKNNMLSEVCINTCADISKTITACIKEKNFTKLATQLNIMLYSNTTLKSQLSEIFFSVKGFEGNLLGYLLMQTDADYSCEQVSGIKKLKKIIANIYKDEVSNIKLYGLENEPSIKDLYEKSYIELSTLIRKYKIDHTHQCLLDITHFRFLIDTHPTLKKHEREDLLNFLKAEINKREDGLFSLIHKNHKIGLKSIIFNSITYNFINLGLFIQKIESPYMHSGGIIAANVIGGAAYELRVPITDVIYEKTNTSAKMLNKSLKYSEEYELQPIIENKKQKLILDSSKNYTIGKLQSEIINNIDNESKLMNILSDLEKDHEKAYFILTDIKDNTFLLSRLITRFEKNKNIIDKLYGLWENIIAKKYPITDIHEFNRFVAQVNVNSPSSGLLAFFIINAIIKNCEKSKIRSSHRVGIMSELPTKNNFPLNMDIVLYNQEIYYLNADTRQISRLELQGWDKNSTIEDVKNYLNNIKDDSLLNKGLVTSLIYEDMSRHFEEVILRAPHIPGSQWHDFLKRCEKNSLLIKTLTTILGSSIRNGINTSIFTGGALSGIGMPLIIVVLAATGAIQGFLNGISDGFTHATIIKTKEYKEAVKTLEKSNVRLDDKLLDKFNNFYKCVINEDLVKLKTLEATPKQLTTFMEEYILDGNSSAGLNLSYKPVSMDQTYVRRLQEAKNIKKKYKIIDEIINFVTDEITDKYDANQALFRLIAIISAGIKDRVERLNVINGITEALLRRDMVISQIMSQERSFITRKKGFIPDIMFGMLSSITSVISLPAVHICGFYQTAAYSSVDILGELLETFNNQDNHNHNTESFQKGISFIKDIILDLVLTIDIEKSDEQIRLIKLEQTSDNIESNFSNLENGFYVTGNHQYYQIFDVKLIKLVLRWEDQEIFWLEHEKEYVYDHRLEQLFINYITVKENEPYKSLRDQSIKLLQKHTGRLSMPSCVDTAHSRDLHAFEVQIQQDILEKIQLSDEKDQEYALETSNLSDGQDQQDSLEQVHLFNEQHQENALEQVHLFGEKTQEDTPANTCSHVNQLHYIPPEIEILQNELIHHAHEIEAIPG